jgi:hypothetical protein
VAAEGEPRSTAGFLLADAGALVFLHLLFEVEAELIVEVAFFRAAVKESAQAK